MENLYQQERTWEITIPDLKLYYRETVIKKLPGTGTETGRKINGIESKTQK